MAKEEELKQLLEKKATFQRGCRCLAAELNASNYQQLMPLVTRAHTLLKTRHTNLDYWRSGHQLFKACSQVALPPDAASQIASYLAASQAFLAEADAADTEASPDDVALPQEAMSILEALGAPMGTASGPSASHYDDAGLIVDDHTRWQRAQTSGAAPAAATASAAQPDQGHGAGSGDPAATAATANGSEATTTTTTTGQGAGNSTRRAGGVNRPTISVDMQRQMLEGIQAVFEGMAAVTRGTEAIERELEAVLSALQERRGASQTRAVPPMSKRLLDSLPVLELDAERLKELGDDTRCPVCTDPLQAGDQVFRLPCRGKHWYHPACVRPWLEKTNSCPVCRDELPTDDPHYEAHKEREAEERQERQGAANALSHNEFMYV